MSEVGSGAVPAPADSLLPAMITDVASIQGYIKASEEFKALLSENAKKRRKRKTPQALKKSREGGQGKTFTYVDRPQYQIWLDENFPGWSVTDYKAWTERAEYSTASDSQNTPVLFCVSLTLNVYDIGLRRAIPCIGTAAVSSKELSRDNSQLLKEKYKAALTEALKTGCGWLGAFFDLRANDDERENAYKEVTKEQAARWDELRKRVPVSGLSSTEEKWKTQNGATADEFLANLARKLDAYDAQLKEEERLKNKKAEGTDAHVG